MNVKKIAVSVATVTLIAGCVTACNGNTTAKAAPKVGQNVANTNQLQNQNENETIEAYNIALKNVENQYPASLMADPLELQMLRERDLYLNDASKTLYIYILPSGRNDVFYSTVRGKVSSMSSEMTATDGVYTDGGEYNGGNEVVPMPEDDLSYGGTECGDNGIFWFDEQGGYHQACVAGATVMIESAPLSLNAIELPQSAMPANILAQMTKK